METLKKQIKGWIIFFMTALVISGLTAIPVRAEINFLYRISGDIGFVQSWMEQLQEGINETGDKYPFLFYGYDWLAFAHIVLAILFIGPLRDPVKNKWVIEFGMIACLLIIPVAFIAGHFRGIPFWWRMVDCSFGVLGLIPLWVCLNKIRKLENEEKKEAGLYTDVLQ
jgi:hypothetical protein